MILQTSQAQWQLGAHEGRWKIADVDNKILLLLPAGISQEEVNEIRHFGMDYEKLAHAEGVEMGKQAMLAANSQRMREMSDQILVLEHMNEELAAKMARFFGDMDS